MSQRSAPALRCEQPAPAGLDIEAVLAKAAKENFPVALGVLSRERRERLLAIYAFARAVDDLGDLYEGDRDAALDWAESEIERGLAGEPAHPIFERAAAMARTTDAPHQAFFDLIAANRLDQEKTRYQAFSELEDYCSLSANPVGRLVLAVFGRSDQLALTYSDRVCTALQVVEHLQDVAEDYQRGRVYLPLEDMSLFGVDEAELDEAVATPSMRRLLALETGRARRLLVEGAPLVRLAFRRPAPRDRRIHRRRPGTDRRDPSRSTTTSSVTAPRRRAPRSRRARSACFAPASGARSDHARVSLRPL